MHARGAGGRRPAPPATWSEALALYGRAADLDPSNDRAVAGRDEMMPRHRAARADAGTAHGPARASAATRSGSSSTTRSDANLDDARAAQWPPATSATRRGADPACAGRAGHEPRRVHARPKCAQYNATIAAARTDVERDGRGGTRWRSTTASDDAGRRAAHAGASRAREERKRTVRERIREAQQLVREGTLRAGAGRRRSDPAAGPEQRLRRGRAPADRGPRHVPRAARCTARTSTAS